MNLSHSAWSVNSKFALFDQNLKKTVLYGKGLSSVQIPSALQQKKTVSKYETVP
jgi:hypothetical protein